LAGRVVCHALTLVKGPSGCKSPTEVVNLLRSAAPPHTTIPEPALLPPTRWTPSPGTEHDLPVVPRNGDTGSHPFVTHWRQLEREKGSSNYRVRSKKWELPHCARRDNFGAWSLEQTGRTNVRPECLGRPEPGDLPSPPAMSDS